MNASKVTSPEDLSRLLSATEPVRPQPKHKPLAESKVSRSMLVDFVRSIVECDRYTALQADRNANPSDLEALQLFYRVLRSVQNDASELYSNLQQECEL